MKRTYRHNRTGAIRVSEGLIGYPYVEVTEPAVEAPAPEAPPKTKRPGRKPKADG